MGKIMNKKDYKLKRPSEGYSTEKERQFAQWSGVSDWEVFFQNKKIGNIYYVGTQLVAWGWDLETTKNKGEAFTKMEALEELMQIHKKDLTL